LAPSLSANIFVKNHGILVEFISTIDPNQWSNLCNKIYWQLQKLTPANNFQIRHKPRGQSLHLKVTIIHWQKTFQELEDFLEKFNIDMPKPIELLCSKTSDTPIVSECFFANENTLHIIKPKIQYHISNEMYFAFFDNAVTCCSQDLITTPHIDIHSCYNIVVTGSKPLLSTFVDRYSKILKLSTDQAFYIPPCKSRKTLVKPNPHSTIMPPAPKNIVNPNRAATTTTAITTTTTTSSPNPLPMVLPTLTQTVSKPLRIIDNATTLTFTQTVSTLFRKIHNEFTTSSDAHIKQLPKPLNSKIKWEPIYNNWFNYLNKNSGALRQTIEEYIELFIIPATDPRIALRNQQGVVAKKPIPAGQVLGFYAGEYRTEEEFNSLPNYFDRKHYDFPVTCVGNEGIVIDAYQQSNILSCINACRTYGLYPDDPRCKENVAFIIIYNPIPVVFIYTLKKILPGQELLIDYGEDFWIWHKQNV
jgi:hypothetical protein